MAFTLRENPSATDSLTTFDATAGAPGTYGAKADLTCNDQMQVGLLAIKNGGSFVQGAATASPPGVYTSASQAYAANTVAGNLLVVDVMIDATFPIVAATASDTQGNVYGEVFFQHIPGSGFFAGSFLAIAKTGANTATVNFTGAGLPAINYLIAVHEYHPTAAPTLDSFATGYNIGGGTVALTVPTTEANDLLHLFAGIWTACPGSPIITGPLNATATPNISGTFAGIIQRGFVGGGTK